MEALENKKSQVMQIPITAAENLVVSCKGFNYYCIDLEKINHSKIHDIIAGLEAVERDTWVAQEDFWHYIKKCHFAVYAEKDGQIVGFNLVSIMLKDEYCIYTVEEAMVLGAFHGNNIGRNVVVIGMWWFMKNKLQGQYLKKFVFVSTSCNPKVVNNYFKNKYVVKILDNSFNPSEELIQVHNEYLKKYNYTLVNSDYPFCLKNMFPGSNQFEKHERIPQYVDGVKSKMPSEFDYVQRGDAWAFMVKGSIKTFCIFTVAISLIFIGSKLLANNAINMRNSKKRGSILRPAPEQLSTYDR